jgi:hypothetical protein
MSEHNASHPAYVDFLYITCATACFLASHFRIGDHEAVFWLGIIFNLFLTANIWRRSYG